MINKIKKFNRQIVQVSIAILYNINFSGFKNKNIYNGNLKKICVPGLNCYSCPGALMSCPIGSLQQSLKTKSYASIYYVVGLIILFGVLFGRTVCGYLCPFGLLQDILYKIKTKKIKKNKLTKKLSYIKYVILLIFVIILPIIIKEPSFCKILCPQGILEGGIILVLMNKIFRPLIGFFFSIKIVILILIIILAIFIYRIFCRFICPLGAIYSLLNDNSIIGIKYEKNKCTNCGRCINICPMDINKVGDKECINCNKCIAVCPEKIIKFGVK